MTKTILLFLCLLLPSQEAIIIHQNSDYITSDPLGNVYLIEGMSLSKFDSRGEKQSAFANHQLGEITWVDASDPLRILLFYKEFNQLLLLNKQLAELGSPIDLYKFSSNESQLVCAARQGGFWLYDPEESQVLHISAKGQVITRSILLNSFFTETSPTQMLEKGEYLYLLLPGKGVLVLTELGRYRQMLHIPGIESFQLDQKGLLYVKKKQLYRFAPDQQADTSLFPDIQFQSEHTRMEAGFLFYGDKNSLHITSLKN